MGAGLCAAADAERIVGLPLGGAEAPAPTLGSAPATGPLFYAVLDTVPGLTVRTEGLFGADLAIWNSPARYAEVKAPLVDLGTNWFRFPNGSLSNDYHWNGEGRMDSTGVWTAERERWSPGFLVETKWRGTTKDNYGFKRASHLVDGDSATLWWGIVDDVLDPPWFVVDLGEMRTVDEVRLQWGPEKPRSYELLAWDSAEAPYPGPHQLHASLWKSVLKQGVSGGVHASTNAGKFSARTARFWAVRFAAKDVGKQGVQVREFWLSGRGAAMTRNTEDAHGQSKVWGVGTRPGGIRRTDWTDIKWQFENFMEYVRSVPGGQAVICVNVATGTVDEAAAWVYYANKVKGYGIRDWQIGNENDGEWEEAGPLSARQYAARFIAFAQAMKKVDPGIRVHGPLHSTDEFAVKGDGMFSGRAWMETFLAVVGEAERKDRARYLDVVDFHTYPYWTAQTPDPVAMARAPLRVARMMDTLQAWMARHLEQGALRPVHLSEFSSTVIGTHQTLRAVQATAVVSLFASFVERFGDRGHALPWDVYGGLQQGTDGTQGSLRMFHPTAEASWSSWGNVYPSAQYYGQYLAFRQWVRAGLRVVPVQGQELERVRAFALASGDTARVLLANLTTVEQTVVLTRASGRSAPRQTLVLGEANYTWQGSDAQAKALPGTGPWAMRKTAAASDTVRVPPLGLAVAQWDPAVLRKTPVEMLHADLAQTTLLPGDTLRLWGTLRQQGGALQKMTWKIAGMGAGEVQALDGRCDGETEGFDLRIPLTKSIKPAEYALMVHSTGYGGVARSDTVPFRVRGTYRTIARLDTNAGWFPYAHGSNSSYANVNERPGPPPYGGYLQMAFAIEQPATQNWPNFVAVHLQVDKSLVAGKARTAGLVFDYSTRHSSETGYFELLALTDAVKDYDEYSIRLRNTHGQWVRDTVLWNKMGQEGWGTAQGPLDARGIRELEWRARSAGDGQLLLDNVYMLGEDGMEIPMPQGLRRLR